MNGIPETMHAVWADVIAWLDCPNGGKEMVINRGCPGEELWGYEIVFFAPGFDGISSTHLLSVHDPAEFVGTVSRYTLRWL